MKNRDLIMELLKYPWDSEVVVSLDGVNRATPVSTELEAGAYSSEGDGHGSFFANGSRIWRDNLVRAICLHTES